jgi:hypothetical protein
VAKKTRPTFQKREREKAQQQKQKDKHARRAEAKERRATGPRDTGEDPDIAGIRPGPQPLPEQWGYERDGIAESERGAVDDNL